jgi:hypothetical protein
MLTYLRNILPGFTRQFAARAKSTAVPVLPRTGISAPVATSPQWEEIADQLEENLKRCELRKIIEFESQIENSVMAATPENCNPDTAYALSRISAIFGRTEGHIAHRDKSKSWFEHAIKLNAHNQNAQSGLRSILVSEGDSSIDATFLAPISSKLK